MFLQVCSELAAGRRLTGTLQTDHQQNGKSTRRKSQLAVRTAHEVNQRVVYDFNYLLPRGQTFKHALPQCFLFYLCNELFDNFEVDIRLQQSQFDFAHRIIDVCLRQNALAFELLKGSLQFFG